MIRDQIRRFGCGMYKTRTGADTKHCIENGLDYTIYRLGRHRIKKMIQRTKQDLFYSRLKNDRQMNKRKHHHGRRTKGRAKRTISPQKPPYDMDVQIRPLHIYDDFVGSEVHP
jgi:hypothetical protein